MPDLVMPAELEPTPLGSRLRLFLHHLRTSARELTDEALSSNWSASNPRFSRYAMQIAEWSARLGEFSVVGYHVRNPFVGAAFIEDSNGRRSSCNVVLDEHAPHLILGSAVFPAPPGVVAREATADDAPALREIEAQTPIVIGADSVFYDRGPDYFAGERLMGEVEMFVVERDGRVVGLAGRAFPPLRIAGKLYKGQYSHRLRLLPEAQGEGVRGPLNAMQMERGVVEAHAGFVNYGFIAAGNEAALRTMEPERRWPGGAVRLIIDTRQNARGAQVRRAVEADAPRLVELFNQMHEREEMFVPFTTASLKARLEREPAAYSWGDILLSERAALGVWDAKLGVRREHGGIVTNDVRALVLDYGCEPGAEDELLELVWSSCSALAQNGTTELSLFSSIPATGYAQMSAFAKRAEAYVVLCWHKPGPDLDQRGVYVDQLYF